MNNYLKNEDSEYLKQHAKNPVKWYPWNKIAHDEARKKIMEVHILIQISGLVFLTAYQKLTNQIRKNLQSHQKNLRRT